MIKTLLILLLSCISLYGGSLTLKWTPKDKYVKYYIVKKYHLSGVVLVERAYLNQKVFNNLLEGQEYWFTVTPVYLNGENGLTSNRIRYIVPKKIRPKVFIQPRLYYENSK